MSQTIFWKKIKEFITSNQKVIIAVLYLLIFLAYIYVIRATFLSALANFPSLLGYNDTQHFWDTAENLLSGKIIYKDFYYEYGYLWLFVQSVFYFIFGRSFFALIISTYIILPIIALVISYFIAKIVLKKDYLIILFLVLCLFFYPNYATTSLRHIVSELGLALFILYLFNKKSLLVFFSGIVVGLGFLASTEYGAAANLAVFIIFLLALLTKKTKFRDLIFYYLGQAIILLPFTLMLWLNKALTNWFSFFQSFAGNFYFASPCGDSFPRLCDLEISKKTSKLILAGMPVEFLQSLNLYLVPLVYLILLLLIFWLIYKKRALSLSNIVKLLLIIYGSIIYLRTLDNPCLGYFFYGLIPFFLLLVLFLDDLIIFIKSSKRKQTGAICIIVILFFWFFITQPAGYNLLFPLPKDTNKFDQETKSLNPKIGYPISSEMESEYNNTIKFLSQNMSSGDFLYVYPWGPYNIFGNFKSPSKFENSMLYQVAGDNYIQIEKDDLEKTQPKFVVINNWNNSGMATFGRSRKDIVMYYANPDEDGPVFCGEGDPIQQYILENYQAVYHNKLAIIMKRRTESIKLGKKYQPRFNAIDGISSSFQIDLSNMSSTPDENIYKITGPSASVRYNFQTPVEGSGVKVKLNLSDRTALLKHFTRYSLKLIVTLSNGNAHTTKIMAWKEDQIINVPFDKAGRIDSVEIKVEKNTGFLWFLPPGSLSVKSVDIL